MSMPAMKMHKDQLPNAHLSSWDKLIFLWSMPLEYYSLIRDCQEFLSQFKLAILTHHLLFNKRAFGDLEMMSLTLNEMS